MNCKWEPVHLSCSEGLVRVIVGARPSGLREELRQYEL